MTSNQDNHLINDEIFMKETFMISEKLMKPAQYAEHQLLTAIIQGEYQPGAYLPGERKLAEQIGVTRPTLRETLQKMAREGWLIIRHGKPTLVKDFVNDGGMGVLTTMARYVEDLPKIYQEHYLKMRSAFFPAIARLSMDNNPQVIEDYLRQYPTVEETGRCYTDYDWGLQFLMATASGNLFIKFFLSDFEYAFKKMAVMYFDIDGARILSRSYYKELLGYVSLRDTEQVVACVGQVMDTAFELWKQLMT